MDGMMHVVAWLLMMFISISLAIAGLTILFMSWRDRWKHKDLVPGIAIASVMAIMGALSMIQLCKEGVHP